MTPSEAAQILGIPTTANAEQLRKAFRTLAKKWHPDAHPNDPHAAEMMKKINEAHAVFLNYLERGSTQNNGATGSQSGSAQPSNNNTNTGRPSGSSNTSSTSRPDYNDYRPRNERRDATMEKIIQDLWNKYQAADKKYREYGPELRKAYEERVRQQDILDSMQKIYNASPTVENLKKLSDANMVYNRALTNHNTAKFQLQTLKFERDLWKREHAQKVMEYKIYKQQGRR